MGGEEKMLERGRKGIKIAWTCNANGRRHIAKNM
jgi:hypothetical protein